MYAEKNEIDNSSTVEASEDHSSSTTGVVPEDENPSEDNQKQVNPEQRHLVLAEAAIERTTSKLSLALAKKARAEKLLAKLEMEETPQQPEIDKEGITEEERYMLRKVGLRMKPFLLLGRRGVFDGTIENMHLHWKYRELVKVITGTKIVEEVHSIARTLEAESGGILVAIERVSKGYAIIVYRGKNYKRPTCLRPQTLLSKREAMKRSLEAQRRQSLKLHVLKLTERIDNLKLQLAKTKDSESDELAEELQLGGVQELEIEKVRSTEDEMSDAIAATMIRQSDQNQQVQEQEIESVESTKYEVSNPTRDTYPCVQQAQESQIVSDATPLSTKDKMEASSNHVNVTQQVSPYEVPWQHTDDKLDEADRTEQEPTAKSASKRFTVSLDVQVEDLQGQTNSYELQVLDGESETSQVVPSDSESGSSSQRTVPNMSERTGKPLRLSNRDRLLLRKQALKIKKHPIFAVGKSNIVIGVAKALKAHFEKHPLAIVNVKGRAKGTSVREVVFKLEEATGAVLVSQEPSKIILYRGWGAEDEPAQTVGKFSSRGRHDVVGDGGKAWPVVSPELISAIRLECGLQSNLGKEFAS